MPCRKPRRSQIANLPPDINRTVTNQLSVSNPASPQNNPLVMSQTTSIGITHALASHQSSPATKLSPCPVTKQTRYSLNILPSKHTTTVVIIYNLQAPTSIDNPSIRHTVTKQTRHPPLSKNRNRHGRRYRVLGLYAKHYFTCRSRLYNIVSVKPVLQIFSMQALHVNELLDEASCHISDAIKADGAGNTKSALEHYSVGVKKLDVALKNITDEKTRLFYTKDRAAVILYQGSCSSGQEDNDDPGTICRLCVPTCIIRPEKFSGTRFFISKNHITT